MSRWLIDLTRLSRRRARRALTGVDRVERAWARHLLDSGDEVFGLVRTRLGYLLLDRCGVRMFSGGALPDLTALRRAAVARALHLGVRRLIQSLAEPFVYLNLAHSGRSDAVRRAVQGAGGRAAWFLHDAIPLEHPDLQSEAAADRMRELFATAAGADLLIFATREARDSVSACLPGPMPRSVIAPLGPGLPDVAPRPAASPPFFLALGTIEPRKNIPFLLDLWDELGREPAPPTLRLIGARGWERPELFARIARTPLVEDLGELPDLETARILAEASGLLFPSRAEGFGIPLLEAARAGVPIIAAPLPVYREWMGDIPVYLETTDRYRWIQRIQELAGGSVQRAARDEIAAMRDALPNWDAHFRAVREALTATA